MRLWNVLVAVGLAYGTLVPTYAAADPASVTWNRQRSNLFMRLCPTTAPDFSDFGATARRNGFTKTLERKLGYQRAEIVASLKSSGGACHCLFSFATDRPDLAAELILKALLGKYGGRFKPDADPKSIGFLSIDKGKLQLKMLTWREFGENWFGLVLIGQRKCPG